MDNLIAVILGGGAGSRLYPLTKRRSKPAVPLAGKYRLIDVPISNCINSGISRIYVLTQFNSASLNRHIARSYQFDRFRAGFVTILAAEQTPSSQEWFQGTADAVRQSLVHLENDRHKYKLILSGDQLYTMDFRKMLASHQEAEADITIATIPVNATDAPGFGIMKTDDEGRVREFHEKPAADQLEGKQSRVSDEMQAQGRIYLASMGIYIFNRGVLADLLDENKHAHDFGKEILPSTIETRRIFSYTHDGYWSDIGTIRSFYEANLMIARPKPPFDMYNPRAGLYTNARMLPPAKIENSTIRESIVAESAVIIGSTITNSVIGLRSFIGNNTVISGVVMMGADYYPWQTEDERPAVAGPPRPGINENTRVENAIIDRNVSVGANCVIVNSDNVQEGERDNFYFRDGIIVLPKGATIPDGTVL